jgi:UPF0716 family protein affecting phage T7 exclusion
VFGGLNRLLAAALVAGVVLVVPPAAFACNSGVSAVNVYKECMGSGGGKSTNRGHATQQTNSSTPAHISPGTARALKKAGRNGKSVAALVKGYPAERFLQSHPSGSTSTTPTAIGSAFDLGSGPTVLLIVLLATGALLLGGTGLRVRRNRQRP